MRTALRPKRVLSGARRRSLESRSHRKDRALERRKQRRLRYLDEYRTLFATAHRLALYFAAVEPDKVLTLYPELRALLPWLTNRNPRQVVSETGYLGRLLEEELGRWMPHQQRKVVFGLSDWFELECGLCAHHICSAATTGWVRTGPFDPSLRTRADHRQDGGEQVVAD